MPKSTTFIVLLVIGLFLSGFSYVIAQAEAPTLQWSNTFGAYGAEAIIQTQDGGFALVGTIANSSFEHRGYYNYAPVLVKISSSGQLEWEKIMGTYSYGATSIAQTSDFGFLVSGNNWLVKTDLQGNIQWSTTTDNSMIGAHGIKADGSAYVIAGFANNQTENTGYPMILKFDLNGTLLWKRTYEASADNIASTVMQANDGNYVVAGNFGKSFWCAKIDTNGNLVWNHTYPTNAIIEVSQPMIRSIAGEDYGFILAGTDGQYAWLVKIDSEGTEQWHQRYSYGRYGFVSVTQTSDSGYIAFCDLGIVKVNKAGSVEWTKPYNSSDNIASSAPYTPSGTCASSGILADDGGVIVAGNINNSIWVAKFAFPSVSPSQTTVSNGAGAPNNITLLWIAIILVVVTVLVVGILVYSNRYRRGLNGLKV